MLIRILDFYISGHKNGNETNVDICAGTTYLWSSMHKVMKKKHAAIIGFAIDVVISGTYEFQYSCEKQFYYRKFM